jgi:SAM-dependent methyltransferase
LSLYGIIYMTGFSSSWLRLRESADHRSRNAELASMISARFALRPQISVTDIGCGAGSNLRGIATLLPARQSWTLVDHDAELLRVAREELADWSDEASLEDETLCLWKGGCNIRVSFRQSDLNADLDGALGAGSDLITAAAFFDLASERFIRRFAQSVSARRAIFYTVLTYNGTCRWQPHHHADNAIVAAFHRHQMTDKGFGVAAGPTAALYLAEEFRLAGYSVREGNSSWRLGVADRALIKEVQTGHAAAVTETGTVDEKTLNAWASRVVTGAVIGHTDTLAFPT